MGLYDGLDLILQSANAPRLDFVFVHSLGLRPETTWHDDSTGKNWIEEPDFVLGLGWRARVMSFRYNSDIASNMSAASILIHAVDLLLHLEKAMASSDNIGLFFIAHGLGGVIVKKALGLRDLLANCPRVRTATTGVVYLGTPHMDTNSEALLQTVKNTVQLLRCEHHDIEDDDVRHFASAVASINATYISTKPAALETISLWETEPSTWDGPDGSEVSDLVVPESCRKPDLWNNLDIAGDCKYLGLPHFSSLFDSRFTKFTVNFSTLVSRVLEHKSVIINAVRISATEVPMSGRPRSPPRMRGRRPRMGEAILARSDSEDEIFASWQKRRQYQEDQARLETFLRSLRGWLPQNTGHEVFVAAGTCDWISSTQALSNWLKYTMYGTFLCLAEPGSGKTHIAKALASHIEKTYPSNVVMAFFCTGNESEPPIWDYFTWSLLQDRPSWFSSVPKRYLGHDEGSERLSFGDFVGIWTSLRQHEEDGAKETIWLVIDGLEACGDEAFLRFWNSLEQLRKRQADSKKPLCLLKVLFTSTLTPAVTAVSGGVSRYIVPPAVVKKDIATYVDARLISFLTADSLPSIKSMAERLAQDVKVAAEDYWLFARDAVDEVELALGSNSAHVASFMSRLPAKLEAHVQQTLLCLRQSVGPARYLYPLLSIILANGKKLSVSQLKDALYSLYPEEEVERLDLAKLAMRHCGGILARGGGECLKFRYSGVARWLGREFTQGRRRATLAYLCMNYLLQDRFRSLPPPKEVGPDPLGWLDRNHPFYYYAAQQSLAHLALAGDDDELLPLFVRLPLESPPQWEVSQSWLRASADYTATREEFQTLPLAVVLRDERLLPILERVCPPPQELTGLSCLQRAASYWRSWRIQRNDRTPRFALPEGWLSARNGDGYTPLLAAAKQGNINMIRYILKWHPNVNERGGPSMQPVLMMLYCSDACMAPTRGPSRLPAITLDLLGMGANLNLADCRGSTALHVACDQGSLPLVRLLLDHGAVINISDQDGCTAWQVACERGGVGLLRELLARGVEADSMFDTGENALTYLARQGCVDKLRAVLPLADVNGFDLKGEAPLHVAVRLDEDRYEVLKVLTSWPGVNLDIVRRLHGEADPEQATGLLAAIKADDGHGVELLLRAGAITGHLPGLQVLPLQLAVRLGHRDIAELLLRHRAPVNEFLFTSAKQTALSIAARAGDTDMLKLLLEYGADPTIEDGLGLPNAALLVLECKTADVAALTLLLECPKPPCIIQDDDTGSGRSTSHSEVFMRTCSLRGIDFAEALLGCGVRLSIWLGRPDLCSPLHAAARSGNLKVCRFLVEKEPRFLNLLCRSGSFTHSPLHEACLHGQSEVVRLLLDKGADTRLLSMHREQSCLLSACIGNDTDTMKMVLAADPCMADVADYNGESPLQVASRNGQVLVVGGLIKAGASMSGRHTCITQSLHGALGDRAIPLLRMLIKHGLDINRPSESLGQTPFFCALAAAPPSVVSWLHKKGGNSLRTCRVSASPEIWELGLRGIRRELSPDVLEAIISSCREHLVDADWSGQNALGSFSSGWRPYLARLFWLCEEIREETSRDLFAEMMVQPDIFGISPVDRSNGITSCRTRSRPRVARVVVEFIDSYLQTPSHQLLGQITHLPVAKLMHHAPEDIGPLLTIQYSARGIYTRPEDGSEVQSHTSSTHRCAVCRKRIFEEAFWCAKCDSHLCRTCVGKDEASICGREDKHLWIWYALDAEVTAHSAKVQAALQRLRAAMLSIFSEQPADRLSQSSTVISAEGESDEKEARVQASLQLATLHAFGMLAVRRRLGSMYLPLSANALEIISPFEGNIAPMRKAWERRMLDEESQVGRRREEMRYMSEGMTRTAYADEKLFRQDMVLEELARLFTEDEGIASDVHQSAVRFFPVGVSG